MPPTRIPKAEDFAHLELHVSLVYPEVPETTTSILILFHGLGDNETSFASFAKNMNLPGVLAISVRGLSPLPPVMLGLPDSDMTTPTKHFHWGDDLTLSPDTGDLDKDPGFSKAEKLVLQDLIRGTLIDRLGWESCDIMLFGFGQGGALVLGLASKIRTAWSIQDGTSKDVVIGKVFKGLVSIGGHLPDSLLPLMSARDKARTPALVCHGRNSKILDDDAMDEIRTEFADVREVTWKRPDDGMPRDREEMLPIMQFFADRLRAW